MPPHNSYHKPMPQQPPGDMNAQFNNMSLDNKPMQTHAGILDSAPGQSNGFYNRRNNQSFNSPRMDYGGPRGGYNNGYSGGPRGDYHPSDWGRPTAADADLEK